ncbi:MAG: hypothetical protein DYH02_08620 [Candidatus Omnitrophica bacterium COP1]|nr:hypothetical protein [Candidatus Omnitrophica bacterium COP1]
MPDEFFLMKFDPGESPADLHHSVQGFLPCPENTKPSRDLAPVRDSVSPLLGFQQAVESAGSTSENNPYFLA